MSFIILENINKTFDGVSILKNINVAIDEGDVLGILGRSGSGKSVLINMLRGTKEYEPDSGKLIYNISYCPDCSNADVPSKAGEKCKCGGEFKAEEVDFWHADRKIFAAIRKRISIMLQRNFALYDEDTVIENVIKAMPEGEYEEQLYKALDLLDMVQMNHRITHLARDLSGGEKQRVVLARQIAKNPMLFLADEPTGTLDPQTADNLHEALINNVKEEGTTMVITSHWPEVMEELADKVIWLENGEIIEEGTPSEIVKKFLKTVPLPKKIEKSGYGENIIVVKNAKKQYYSIDRGVIKAVDDISIEIKEGEIFGIIGLSGSGKTTLNRMLKGLTKPTSGDIKVRLGDNWIDMKTSGPHGRGRVTPYIGFLPQEYSLYPDRNVLGNLTDAISLDLPAEFAKMKAIHVLNAVGFDSETANNILDKKPNKLSKGEEHRVAIAQILIKEPNIVILDEPSGTMDPVTIVKVTDFILKEREELNQTFIITAHDMGFISNVCDTVVLIRGGKVIRIGNPTEIIDELTPTEKEKMLNK
ncbi:MAG: methyl coenzyme M reductase system, component A2 [Methanobrevibacter sp.]|jgi:methyl coenzyme M reductase system subunit A2|nr:methyl coenzyme M reductase system, component A2 [Methanobrevibacter sp.]